MNIGNLPNFNVEISIQVTIACVSSALTMLRSIFINVWYTPQMEHQVYTSFKIYIRYMYVYLI